MPKSLTVVVLAVVALTGSNQHSTVVARALVHPVRWAPCHGSFECAVVPVPLDYGDVSGPTILLSLIKLRAADPSRRIGALLINPGGPGGSGVDTVLNNAQRPLVRELQARFDIIGFDPRGVARSTPLRCFGHPWQWAPAFVADLPMSPAMVASVVAADTYLADACDQRAGAIRDHMSTADVARDIDVIRAALGEEQLNYVGFSYGSMLGQTYANLFPGRVRAIVMDGILDPIAWTAGAAGEEHLPVSTRLRSDEGAQATLEEFFRLCDEAGPRCAFSGGAATRFATLRTKLLVAPVLVDLGGGESFPFTYTDLVFSTLGALYSPPTWTFHAGLLAAIEGNAPAATLGTRFSELRTSLGYVNKRGFPRYPNAIEAFPGVLCSDSNNPSMHGDWFDAAEAAEAQFGYFGRAWTWASSACAVWTAPAEDRYSGPWDAATANPILIIGNHFDPATRYQGAVTAAGLLPNSRLLSYSGWGHTVLGEISTCLDSFAIAYLVDLVLPTEGTVCEPESVPFDGLLSPEEAGAAMRRRGQSDLLPEATKRALRG